jgi:hypothetical protein
MPNEPIQMLVFDFEASIETNPQLDQKTEKRPPESEAVEKLNSHSDEIAQELQKEIRRLFRSSVTVQAELTFHEGSIIVEGTIIVMSWLGPLALAAAKKAVEEEFSRVIGVVTKRILQRAVRRIVSSFNAVVGDIKVNYETAGFSAESGKTGRQSSNLMLFTIANSIMLLALVVIQLISLFKQKIP